MQAVVQPYTGSSTFLPLLDNGELDFGIINAVDMGLAYQGQRLKIGGKNPLPHTPSTRLIMRGSPLLTSHGLAQRRPGENRLRRQRQTRHRRISGSSRRLVQRLRLARHRRFDLGRCQSRAGSRGERRHRRAGPGTRRGQQPHRRFGQRSKKPTPPSACASSRSTARRKARRASRKPCRATI